MYRVRAQCGSFFGWPSRSLSMIQTPYYLIDKQKLLGNMEKIAYVRE